MAVHIFEPIHFAVGSWHQFNHADFNTAINPAGTKLRVVFGSDLGHWDVADAEGVVAEAYELVERNLINEDDFRAFMLDNPVQLYTGNNPGFFDGTRCSDAVRARAETLTQSSPARQR